MKLHVVHVSGRVNADTFINTFVEKENPKHVLRQSGFISEESTWEKFKQEMGPNMFLIGEDKRGHNADKFRKFDLEGAINLVRAHKKPCPCLTGRLELPKHWISSLDVIGQGLCTIRKQSPFAEPPRIF